MGKRRKDDLRLRERGVRDADELDALVALAGGRLGGGECDRGPGMAGEEAQQLLADVPRGPEHANRDA